MSSITKCKKCGTSIAPGEKRCAWCGSKVRKSHKKLAGILFLIAVACAAIYILLPKKLMIGFEGGNLRIKTKLDLPAATVEKNDYDVEFTKCDIVDGKAVITYRLTNNTDISNSEFLNITIRAFQDGLELDKDYNDITDGTFMKNIQAGATVELKKSFKLSNMDSPVALEATEFTGGVLSNHEFKIK